MVKVCEIFVGDFLAIVDFGHFVEGEEGHLRVLFKVKHRSLQQIEVDEDGLCDEESQQNVHNGSPAHPSLKHQGNCRFPDGPGHLHSHPVPLATLAQADFVNEGEAKSDGRVGAEAHEEQPQTDHVDWVWDTGEDNCNGADEPGDAHGQSPAEVVSDVGDDEEAEDGAHEHHVLQQGDLVLVVLADEVGLELKYDGGGVPVDVVAAQLGRQAADKLLALGLLQDIRTAGVWVVEEEGHAQEQPWGQEPHQREHEERDLLVSALAVHFGDKSL